MELFVYGTLRKGMANSRLMEGARLVEPEAWARGELYDTGLGYPAMIEGDGIVVGEIYRIDPEYLPLIDDLEDFHGPGHPENLYERVVRSVRTSGGFVSASLYLHSRPDEIRPHCIRIESGDWCKYIQKNNKR